MSSPFRISVDLVRDLYATEAIAHIGLYVSEDALNVHVPFNGRRYGA